MCGIAGIWYRGGEQPDFSCLEVMGQALAHRGPDDAGFYQQGRFGAVHRRLAVIDTSSGGHQPMVTPDGRYALVFNGEVYNYQALAAEHLADMSLQSTSDSEVLLHLLARFGTEALTMIRGMFAFALWDTQQEQLLLARDPVGKKPLFYYCTPEKVVFASEPSALIAAGVVAAEIDPAALTSYFAAEYPPAPASAWQGVRQLPYGTALTITTTSESSVTYWQPVLRPKYRATETQLIKRFDQLLDQAVTRRLVADVPVGIFLSGGLDSSTVGWYVSQHVTQPMHSFSVSFAQPDFDESAYARQVAAVLGLEHHDTSFGLAEFDNLVQEYLPRMDMPLADASLLPTALIARQARQLVTVVLDGDGSDELLGGYGTFRAAEVAQVLPTDPWVGDLARRLVDLLPTKHGNFTIDFIAKSFARGLGYPLARRNAVWLGSFSDTELRHLLQPSWQHYIPQIFSAVDAVAARCTNEAVVDQVSCLTIDGYLHNDILVKLDRATMAWALEARTPFLDVDLIDFITRLPVRYKRNKYILKRLMRGRLPQEIIDRPKKGFGIPLGEWLAGPRALWAQEVLNSKKITEQGILNNAYVQRLLSEHQSRRVDHRKKIWTLLNWQIWYDTWVVD